MMTISKKGVIDFSRHTLHVRSVCAADVTRSYVLCNGPSVVHPAKLGETEEDGDWLGCTLQNEHFLEVGQYLRHLVLHGEIEERVHEFNVFGVRPATTRRVTELKQRDKNAVWNIYKCDRTPSGVYLTIVDSVKKWVCGGELQDYSVNRDIGTIRGSNRHVGLRRVDIETRKARERMETGR